MKSFAHLAGFSFALAAAGLGSGCATSTPTAAYQRPAQDFEVVESSTDRPLTETEKSEVRASVASYLDREGVSDSGDYFLKVYLTPEDVDADSDWVVVRFTRYTDQRVVMVNSYPYDSLTYSSYYPYYAYDIYPYGYGCVARISFQYYVDPIYNHRHYYYPYRGHGGHKGGSHNTAHHGGKPDRPGDHHGSGNNHSPTPNRPSGPGYASNRPTDGSTPTRYNRNYPYTPVPPQDSDVTSPNPGQQSADSRNHWRGRPGVGVNPSGVAGNGNRPDTPNRGNDREPRRPGYRPGGSTPAATPSPADGNTPPRYNRNNPNANAPVTAQDSNATAGTGQLRDNPRNQWRSRPGTNASPSGVANNGNRPEAPNRVNNPNSRPQHYRPAGNVAGSASNPVGNPSTPRRQDRTDSRPAPSPVNNPPRTEATANRSAPSYTRPAPSAQQTRTQAPSYQQQPSRMAPASSDGNSGDNRRSGNNQREALR